MMPLSRDRTTWYQLSSTVFNRMTSSRNAAFSAVASPPACGAASAASRRLRSRASSPSSSRMRASLAVSDADEGLTRSLVKPGALARCWGALSPHVVAHVFGSDFAFERHGRLGYRV
jgi:hypothetical protein